MTSQNKWVFISGSSGGIGTALIEAFAKEGCCILAHARKPNESFESRISEFQYKYGTHILPIYFDMLDESNMKAEISKLYSKKIYPSVLVNNAGVAHGGLFQMTSISKIMEVFEINLFSTMRLTQLLLKGMSRVQEKKAIINVASIAGMDLLPGNSAYGVSKAAIIAWTKTLAGELGTQDIRVNAVAPGLTDTDMGAYMTKNAGKEMLVSSAMERLANPEEIAEAVVFLADNKASFVNGEVLRVDGGGVVRVRL